MNVRRAPLLATAAASGVLAAAVAVPLVLNRQSSLEAVPAPPVVAAAATDAPTPTAEDLAARAAQDSRDLDRPAVDRIAGDRVAAQQQLAAAIGANQQALSDQAKADARAAAEKAAKAAAAKAAASSGGSSYTGAPRDIGRTMAQAEFGWGAAQFQCYDQIIMHESEWNPKATNPSSGAYGIPQALPGSKMASAGSDWRTNPVTQIRWGLGYVKERYGTPCQAWSFKSAHGWY